MLAVLEFGLSSLCNRAHWRGDDCILSLSLTDEKLTVEARRDALGKLTPAVMKHDKGGIYSFVTLLEGRQNNERDYGNQHDGTRHPRPALTVAVRSERAYLRLSCQCSHCCS